MLTRDQTNFSCVMRQYSKILESRKKYLSLKFITSFIENVHRFGDPKYSPTLDDVLRVRARSYGIIEASFEIKETKFTY